MKTLAMFLVLSLAPWIALGASPELVLAGGGVRVCSSLAPNACRAGTHFDDAARAATSRYHFSQASTETATSIDLWSASPPAVRALVSVLVRDAASNFESRALDADALTQWFAARCAAGREATDRLHRCRGSERPVWDALLDDERAALLAALELPDLDDRGQRRREVVQLDATTDASGPQILRAFVAAAARRSKLKPRIAFVTAASIDAFASVDFYRAAFAAAGAEVQWWPIDAASVATATSAGDCKMLEAARRRHLQLPGRDRVYPDLAAEQERACADAASFFSVPDRVDGIFFGGGDQWRLRRAFFDSKDQPNAALKSLRAAFARGALVVGGTSAGMAVQSDRSMLTSGDSSAAMKAGAKNATPPPFGCARAGRCPKGIGADDLTTWAGGGFGLAPGMLFDTHFSERGREVRLMRALADSDMPFGIGADENTAVHLRQTEAPTWQVDVIGAGSVWMFEQARLGGCAGSTRLSAIAHNLRPGVQVVVDHQALRPAQMDDWIALDPSTDGVDAASLRQDPLSSGALRDAVQVLAKSSRPLKLGTDRHAVRMSRISGTRSSAASHAASILSMQISVELAPGGVREAQKQDCGQ